MMSVPALSVSHPNSYILCSTEYALVITCEHDNEIEINRANSFLMVFICVPNI